MKSYFSTFFLEVLVYFHLSFHCLNVELLPTGVASTTTQGISTLAHVYRVAINNSRTTVVSRRGKQKAIEKEDAAFLWSLKPSHKVNPCDEETVSDVDL